MASKKCLKAIERLIGNSVVYGVNKHLCDHHDKKNKCEKLEEEKEAIDKFAEELEKECTQ